MNGTKLHLQAASLCLRAADRHAYTGCGSTACSIETVYGGKGDLHTLDARPALLGTPSLASLATPRHFTGDALYAPLLVRPVDDALLALLS